MLIMKDEQDWMDKHKIYIDDVLKYTTCIHSGEPFNGNYSSIGFSILMKSGKIIWWYITPSHLLQRPKYRPIRRECKCGKRIVIKDSMLCSFCLRKSYTKNARKTTKIKNNKK